MSNYSKNALFIDKKSSLFQKQKKSKNLKWLRKNYRREGSYIEMINIRGMPQTASRNPKNYTNPFFNFTIPFLLDNA